MSSVTYKPDRQIAPSRWVRPSTPEDGPAIVALMREVGLEPHIDPVHLYWKYWQERPDWPGARSFVLTNGREILAHGAVVPGLCQWSGASRRVLHMIDWAARHSEVGNGVLLMRHVGRLLADFLLGIGGSAQTLEFMPGIGFKACGIVTGYVRSLSPLALLKRPSRPRWKRAPRFARSVLWSMTAPGEDAAGWETRRIGVEELDRIASVLPVERPGLAVFERSIALFRHLLSCPIVPVELHVMEKAGRAGGYFLLSYAPGQARLADCWMVSEDAGDWRALVHAAVRQARAKGNLAEFVTWSSEPVLSRALEYSGFHSCFSMPIYLRSTGALAVPGETMRVQMVENDAVYLYSGYNELWA